MQVGRHFQETDELYSVITRQSIDTLKEHFRAEAEPSDWALMCVARPVSRPTILLTPFCPPPPSANSKKLKPLFAIE